VVDAIWSLQYAAAGPICASAGPLPAALARMPPPSAACSHAVLFRYGTEAALQRFQAQPRVRLMLSGADAPQGTGGSPCLLEQRSQAHPVCLCGHVHELCLVLMSVRMHVLTSACVAVACDGC
jgi:hypothetical protein